MTIEQLFDFKYTIYVHCCEVYNLFARAFERGRKTRLWRDILACLAASANKSYIY